MYTVAISMIGLALGSLVHPVLSVMLAVAGGWFGWRMDAARKARNGEEAPPPSRFERAQQRASALAKTPPTKRKRATKASGHLSAYRGMYSNLDIVGESHRQAAIQKLWRGPDFTHTAVMVPEANNHYDTNAVRVDVEGVQVGYLSRETAVDYRDCMGDTECQVPVHFVKGGKEGMIGVFTGRSKADRERIRADAAKTN